MANKYHSDLQSDLSSVDFGAAAEADFNAQVDLALNTAIPASNVADSVNDVLLDQVKPRLPASGTIAILTDLTAIQGGARTIESLGLDHDASLDIAQVRTIASPVTLTSALQYIFSSTPGTPFYFAGGFISRATGAWATSESVTVIVEVKFDGTNWRTVWTATFTAEPAQVAAAVPADADTALLNIPKGFYNNGDGVRVGIQQTVVGAGYHTWAHSFIDAVRGA
jgi:hypothetical protein